MPFAMFFSGGQAVHYSSDFAARGYAGATHGCVNVRDLAGIRWLFDQVQRRRQGRHLLELRRVPVVSGPRDPRGVTARARRSPGRWSRAPSRSADLPAAARPAARRPADDLAAPRRGLVAWGVAAECRTGGPTGSPTPPPGGTAWPGGGWSPTRSTCPAPAWSAWAASPSPTTPATRVLVVPQVVVGTSRRPVLAHRRRQDEPAPTRAGALAPGPAAAQLVFADGALTGADWEWSWQSRTRSSPASWTRWCSPATWSPPPRPPSTCGWPLRRLAERYAMCWTFDVDGLFGATPELLVRRERGLVTSRVLAGTIRRTGDDAADAEPGRRAARSSKDLEEHEYAVRSVADVAGAVLRLD